MIKRLLITTAVIFLILMLIDGLSTGAVDNSIDTIGEPKLTPFLKAQIVDYFWQNTKYKTKHKALFKDLEKHGYEEWELAIIFSDSRIEFIKEPRDTSYLDSLFSEKSIQKGKDILVERDSLLQAVEDKYSVDREIIISILRVESNLGEFLGFYRVFNVFYTKWLRAYRYKIRKYARNELKCFLIICKENDWDPLTIYGSYAGALGWAQFIPSSYRRWAVDGDGDGKVNLFTLADALHSIANYLKEFHWRQERWDRRNKRAIYAYNHSWGYVKLVHKYAKKIGFGSNFK
jgi:membrane-bound lytic murein transglycosylase B